MESTITRNPAEYAEALSGATSVHVSSIPGVSLIVHRIESIEMQPTRIAIHLDPIGTIWLDHAAIREIETGVPAMPTIRMK